MEQSRYFNKIEIIDDYTIKKSSTDKHKIKAEYLWFQNDYNFCHPGVENYTEDDDVASYIIEYMHGKTLARYFLDGDINQTGIDNIFEILKWYCTREQVDEHIIPHTSYTKMLIQSMYRDKTYERLAQTNIDLDKTYTINGFISPTIREMIEDSPVYIDDKSIRYVHGDLCFSNIIINSDICQYEVKNNPAKYAYLLEVIDPRGYLPDGKFTNIGDVNYDVAKLAHSVIGRYDQIKNKGFYVYKNAERDYSCYISTTSWQKDFEDKFLEVFKDFDYYNIMIHLFFSMIPLHKDNPEHQEAMLVNAIRLYLERKKRVNCHNVYHNPNGRRKF